MPVTGVELGLGAIKTIVGLGHEGKTKKEAATLAKIRPKYNISPEAKDDLSLAESELSTGMSARSLKAYQDLENQQLTTSVSGILKGGGTVNNIGDIYGRSEEGKMKLALMQDQLRLNQINNLVKSRLNMQDQRDKVFAINEDAPWKDRAQANAAARTAANKEVWDGVNTMGSAAMGYFSKKKEDKEYDVAGFGSIGELSR